MTKLSVEGRVAVLEALVIETIEFKDQSVFQCLKILSGRCAKETGMGFSIVIKDVEPQTRTLVTLKAKTITVKELFALLGTFADVSIRLKPEGCFIEKTQVAN